MSTPPASSNASSPSPCTLHDTWRGRTRQRQSRPLKRRQPEMECERDAQPAAKRRLDINKPRFQFPPPSPESSRSRKRSPSPTRNQLIALKETGEPRVYITTEDIREDEDEGAQDLWMRLRRAATGLIIPGELRDHMGNNARYRETFTAVGEAPSLSNPAAINRLWWRVQHIIREAHRCESDHKDENAWSEVVRLVLKTVLYDFAVEQEDAVTAPLEITNIQSQSVSREYLPRFRLTPGFCDRKTDFVLAFSPTQQDYNELRESLQARGESSSHMNDAYTSTIALVQPIEVKPASGSMEEAQLQLGVFNTAALRFLAQSPPQILPPLPGWSVVGHSWTLSITWAEKSDEQVHVRAPSLSRSIGTQNLEALFALFAVLREELRWIREEYWPAYRELMRPRWDMSLGTSP